jgi:hypothetical protein
VQFTDKDTTIFVFSATPMELGRCGYNCRKKQEEENGSSTELIDRRRPD